MKKVSVRLVWFNIVLKGLILTDLCQSCNFPAMNIAFGYIFEFTAKFVLTYHGHKFARESHCLWQAVRGERIVPNDWLFSKVSSWQPAKKILIPEKTHWQMYIHCGLWNVPNQQQFEAVKLKLIGEYNLWEWLSLPDLNEMYSGVGTRSCDKNIIYSSAYSNKISLKKKLRIVKSVPWMHLFYYKLGNASKSTVVSSLVAWARCKHLVGKSLILSAYYLNL